MAQKRTKPNWQQRRFAWFLVRLGNGAEGGSPRRDMPRSDAQDYGSKLQRKPRVLILALQLDERRRLRRLPVAAKRSSRC